MYHHIRTRDLIKVSSFLAFWVVCLAAQHGLAYQVVVGWGDNTFGQVVPPADLGIVTAVAAGSFHSLALKSDGTVVAWGYNRDTETNVPPDLSGVVAIAAGAYHSLALRNNGTVVQWGAYKGSLNYYGQGSVPSGLANVSAIAAGTDHSLAVRSNGTVVAWGNNDLGQTNVPAGLSGVVAVAGGVYHSLALRSNGTIVGWGSDVYGQSTGPATASGVAAIAASQYFSMALKSNGTVVAWGYNGLGQANVPSGLTNVIAISAGDNHNLALKSDGTVVAWGDNSSGQTSKPPGLFNVTAIAAGGGHSLALGNLPLEIFCPSDITVTGLNNVPSPDPGSVFFYNGCPPVTVTHGGDSSVMNGCTNIIQRLYQAMDACGHSVSCIQTIKVLNPPKLLGFSQSQTVQPGGLQVTICPILGGGSPTSYEWTTNGDPAATTQCLVFFRGALANDSDFQANLIVRNPCGFDGDTAPYTTCAICLSRGAPSLLSGTDGSGTVPSVPSNNCGLNSSTAKWFKMVVTNDAGLVTISTEGSGSSDTILAVYTGPIISPTTLTNEACNGDISSSNKQSRVTFNAEKGQVYWVVIDPGTNASGLRLATGFEPRLTNYTLKADSSFELNSTIAPAIPYRLQAATSIVTSASNWATILSTNLTTNYPFIYFRDTNATKFQQRFYRIAPGP